MINKNVQKINIIQKITSLNNKTYEETKDLFVEFNFLNRVVFYIKNGEVKYPDYPATIDYNYLLRGKFDDDLSNFYSDMKWKLDSFFPDILSYLGNEITPVNIADFLVKERNFTKNGEVEGTGLGTSMGGYGKGMSFEKLTTVLALFILNYRTEIEKTWTPENSFRSLFLLFEELPNFGKDKISDFILQIIIDDVRELSSFIYSNSFQIKNVEDLPIIYPNRLLKPMNNFITILNRINKEIYAYCDKEWKDEILEETKEQFLLQDSNKNIRAYKESLGEDSYKKLITNFRNYKTFFSSKGIKELDKISSNKETDAKKHAYGNFDEETWARAKKAIKKISVKIEENRQYHKEWYMEKKGDKLVIVEARFQSKALEIFNNYKDVRDDDEIIIREATEGSNRNDFVYLEQNNFKEVCIETKQYKGQNSWKKDIGQMREYCKSTCKNGLIIWYIVEEEKLEEFNSEIHLIKDACKDFKVEVIRTIVRGKVPSSY